MRFTPVLALIAIAAATQGCIPAPQTTKVNIAATAPTTAVAASTQPTSKKLWKAETIPASSTSTATTRPIKRIAITQFAVEFVTVRSRTPFQSQLAVKIPPWNPIGGAIELIGFGRAETPIGPKERATLTTALSERFSQHLRDLGYELLAQSTIHSSTGYAEMTAGHPDDKSASSSPLDYLRLLSTDVGVINASTIVPAPGTRLTNTDQAQDKRRASECSILHDTDADLTLSVRLLVGCYGDKAAVEQGSMVRVMKADSSEITLVSQRSFQSSDKVREPAHFVPVVGNVEPLKEDAFNAAIEALLVPYLEPALEESLNGNNCRGR